MVNECSCKGYNDMTLQKKLLSVGNYKFTGKKLGKGNFARVEEAINTVLNIKVAVKIMDITQIKEDYIIRNLHREARIMSQLRHPCIASLFQTIQNGALYYLVSELIGGGDLCTFIKTQKYGKLDERNTRVYARQLISALGHMHNRGIVHRDLKMENVMMNSSQTQIKIVDFGLSNAYDPSSPLRTHCGSPEYAAPELFVPSKSYGPEVDLWSLGVILFGMVVGQLPFVANHEDNLSSQERRKRLLIQINKGYSNTQRKILSLASTDFKSMISRMLIADAAKRITTNELILHVWVTDKGRKCVITNPFKKLGEEWQTTIMKRTGSLLRLEWTTVKYARSSEPYGDVAGVYNIIAHQSADEELEGDGVTKTAQPQRYVIPSDKKDSSLYSPSKMPIRKRSERVKSPSLHKMQKVSTENSSHTAPPKRAQTSTERRSPPIASSMHTKKTNDRTQMESALRQRVFSTDARNRLQSMAEKHIKQQLHYLKQQFIPPPADDFTRAASPYIPRAQTGPSSIGQRQMQQQTIVKTKIQQPSKPSTPRRIYSTNSKNEVRVVGSKGLAQVLLQKKQTVKTSRSSPRSSHINADTTILDQGKNKIELSRVTRSGVRSANLPQQQQQQQPKIKSNGKSKRPTTAIPRSLPVRIQRPRTTTAPLNVVERSPFAQGDVFKRKNTNTITAKQSSEQKSILTDPIARSIVGYIVKTLPNKPEVHNKVKKTRAKTPAV